MKVLEAFQKCENSRINKDNVNEKSLKKFAEGIF